MEDLPEGWNLSNALSYIGLGILAPIKAISPLAPPEVSKEQFAGLLVTLSHLQVSYADNTAGQDLRLLC